MKQIFFNNPIRILIGVTLLLTFNLVKAQQMNDEIITDSSFLIKEIPQESYHGVFKDGKPYEGYFKKGDRDIYTVDFYKEGAPVYQYSFDVLDLMNREEVGSGYEEQVSLDIKSLYKDGQITDGVAYQRGKDGILARKIKKGVLVACYLDVFAVHYYNRIQVGTNKKDVVQITALQEKEYKLELSILQDNLRLELSKNEQVAIRLQVVEEKATVFPPDSRINFFMDNDVIRGMAIQYLDTTGAIENEAYMLTAIMNKLEVSGAKNQQDLLDKVVSSIAQNFGFASEKEERVEEKYMLGYCESDQEGVISKGIRCLQRNEAYYYQVYKNRKVIKEEATTILEFRDILSDYFKNKYDQDQD